jgi:predicted nucleic acid-binding protein
MARILLDTTVLIDVLRGRPAADRVLAMRRYGDVPLTSAINVEEVIRGLRPVEATASGRLFDGLRIVPIRRPEAEQAGQWRRGFASRGVALSQADCLIAAACHSAGATLATANVRQFPMRAVRVEDWPVGR